MYEWLKAFHVIAIIAWMAGMLYLPRLFVYHCEAEPGLAVGGGTPSERNHIASRARRAMERLALQLAQAPRMRIPRSGGFGNPLVRARQPFVGANQSPWSGLPPATYSA